MSEAQEPTLCFFCPTELLDAIVPECRMCHRPYCSEHTSPMDNTICAECINFVNTSIKSEPLIDSDGVTKQNARKITLSGESWLRNKKLIANMTDIELDSYISAHQEAVHEAEIVADYRRIALGHAQHEKAERSNKKARARSERIKLISTVNKVHKIAGSNIEEKKEDLTKALNALGKLGLSKEQIAVVLTNLMKNKPRV